MNKRFQKKTFQQRDSLDPGGQQGFFYEEAFRFTLKRERARADRSSGCFSLVVFDLPERGRGHSADRLIDSIAKKIRITDSIGWLADDSIGVLLPDTPGEGARVFLGRVLESVPKTETAPNAHIYTYPDPVGSDMPYSGITEDERFFKQKLAIKPPSGRHTFERVVAGLALVFLSPLILLIVVAVKLSSPGPVIFRQKRIGHKGREFSCLKFRTMHRSVETAVHETYFSSLIQSDVPMQKLDQDGDPRIFPVGRLLRASSLDELPQLFNILKGEMSLIGPRPCTPHEYNEYLPWHRHRTDTLPGLTGLWQVNGKNKTTFAEMVRLDLRYVRHQSPYMDMVIILKTLPVVVGQYIEDRRGGNDKKPYSKKRMIPVWGER